MNPKLAPAGLCDALPHGGVKTGVFLKQTQRGLPVRLNHLLSDKLAEIRVVKGRLRFRLGFSIVGCGKHNANFRK